MEQKYTWIKFADDKNGTGMSDSHEGKKYMGIAENKTSPNDSNNPDDYVWSPMLFNENVISNGVLKFDNA